MESRPIRNSQRNILSQDTTMQRNIPQRINSGTMKNSCAVFLLICIVSAHCLSPSILNHRSISSLSIVLNARGSGATLESDVVYQVKPKKIKSRARARAIEAMGKRGKITGVSADTIVDDNILEAMFQDIGVVDYPIETKPKHRKHTKRPKMVAGAMGYKTMLEFQRREEEYEELFAEIDTSMYTPVAITPPIEMPPAPVKNISTKSSSRTKKAEPKDVHIEGAQLPIKVKKLKSVKPKKPKTRAKPKFNSDNNNKAKGGNYHKVKGLKQYYQTELLTAKEEYSLGTKIEFMIKCDTVHEGLAMQLQRLPTILEWAEACGFKENEEVFCEPDSDIDIRPQGAAEMFVVQDPNEFVGNGRASELGVGRGHGRRKKLPPVALKDFLDDTENKFRQKGSRKLPSVLVNTGTVLDFVRNIQEAKRAKQRMVSSNMRLVLSISRKYTKVGVNLLDLVQEGSLGLSRAADKFEPKKGFKFSTYASWWIQQAVFRAIAYHSRIIRLPVHVHNLLNRIRKVKKKLEHDLSRPPTNEEMSSELDMPLSKYNKMMKLTRRAISLETPKFKQPLKVGTNEIRLGDTVSTNNASPEESETDERTGVAKNLFHEDLRGMLQTLEEDEKRVISARYGLEDGFARSVTTVASQMNMSRSWVRSTECKGLRKLRRPWYEKRLKEHQNSIQG